MAKSSAVCRPDFWLVGVYLPDDSDPLMGFVSRAEVCPDMLRAEDRWNWLRNRQQQRAGLAVAIYVRPNWVVSPMMTDCGREMAETLQLTLHLIGELTADTRDTFRLMNMRWDRHMFNQ